MNTQTPVFDTAEDFEQWYAKNSMIDIEYLRRMGKYGKRCDCGDELCTGWQMAYREPEIRKHVHA